MPERNEPANQQTAPIEALVLLQQAARIAVLEDRIKQLEYMTVTDPLTGLLNRRGFDRAFLAEQDRIKRASSRGGLVVMIDLDRFKAINDTLGHDAGDKCLQLVAQTLTAGIRDMDTAARLGGDEFALLLTNTFADAALNRVQHLSLNLNKMALNWHGQSVFIGASIGVRPVGTNETLADILMHADADMYANKRASTNRPARLLDTQRTQKIVLPQATQTSKEGSTVK